MNVKIGTEAALFSEKEYINGIQDSPKYISFAPAREASIEYEPCCRDISIGISPYNTELFCILYGCTGFHVGHGYPAEAYL
jgi:hypothetical protein